MDPAELPFPIWQMEREGDFLKEVMWRKEPSDEGRFLLNGSPLTAGGDDGIGMLQ
jgi:hypothetical protein